MSNKDTAAAGSVFIENTTTNTGLDCEGFWVLEDAVVDTIIYKDIKEYDNNTGSVAGISLTARQWVPGRFKEIKLVSGAIQCINYSS